jgi:hypothetical protein
MSAYKSPHDNGNTGDFLIYFTPDKVTNFIEPIQYKRIVYEIDSSAFYEIDSDFSMGARMSQVFLKSKYKKLGTGTNWWTLSGTALGLTNSTYTLTVTDVSAGTVRVATQVTTPYLLDTYGKFTHINSTNDSTATTVASIKMKAPWLDGTYGTFTYVKTSADSAATIVVSSTLKTPYVFCTGSSGAIFTATDGTYWKLRINSSGVATYVTVTP